MIEAGKLNSLRIIKVQGDILTFDAEVFGNIDVVNNDLIIKYQEGQTVDVFLMPDTDGTVTAHLGKAYANANELARLKVVANTKFGSFFDLGLEKDLFCPFKEQKSDLEVNSYYLVYVYIDEETNRLAGSTKYERFLSDEKPELFEQQDVEIVIVNKSQLGYNAIVENKYRGLLYDNEVFSELKSGQKLSAVVKKIREDNKIDLRLYRNDHKDISEFEQKIVNYLNENGGKMNITDESDPEQIYKIFEISKKNFKKALGALYRKGIVELNTYDVCLIK